MQEQHAFPFLREIILFLILSGILIPLLQRLRINQVLGFLAVGTVAGPYGLGLLADRYPVMSIFTFPSGEGGLAQRRGGTVLLGHQLHHDGGGG